MNGSDLLFISTLQEFIHETFNALLFAFLFREDHIALAMLRLLENEKVILETDGATGLGALIGGYLPELKGKR